MKEEINFGLRHALLTSGIVLVASTIFYLTWHLIIGKPEIYDLKFESLGEVLQIVSYGVGARISGDYLKKNFSFEKKNALQSSTQYSAILLGIIFLLGLVNITLPLLLIFAIGAPVSILTFYLVSKKVLSQE